MAETAHGLFGTLAFNAVARGWLVASRENHCLTEASNPPATVTCYDCMALH